MAVALYSRQRPIIFWCLGHAMLIEQIQIHVVVPCKMDIKVAFPCRCHR